MKRILAFLLCSFIILSLVSCHNVVLMGFSWDSPSTEHFNTFISQREQNTWKENLAALLYSVQHKEMQISSEITSMSLASVSVGLMDINFDNVPEVFFAYQGGSMGNIPIDIYDLKSGKKLGHYEASRSPDGDSICLYVAESNDGFIILSEGTIRVPDYQHMKTLSVLDTKFDSNGKLSEHTMFAQTFGDNTTYYEYNKEIVTREVYNAKYKEFFNSYSKIEGTQIVMITWEYIGFDLDEFPNLEFYANRLANALLDSKQKFVDYTK